MPSVHDWNTLSVIGMNNMLRARPFAPFFWTKGRLDSWFVINKNGTLLSFWSDSACVKGSLNKEFYYDVLF